MRFARALRSLGVGGRRSHRHLDGEQRPVPGGHLGGPALRPLLHGDQHPSAPRRGAVHPRRLRRRGAGEFGGDGRAGGRARPVAHRRLGLRGGGAPRVPGLRRPGGGRGAGPARRRVRGPGDAVLLGHHRAPEGRAQAAAGHPARGPRLGAGADCHGPRRLGERPRLGLPVAGPALPRRAARLVHVAASLGRDGGRDGALRSPPVPRAHRALPGHPRAVRADDVRPPAAPARRRAGALRPLEPGATCSTPPRRARSR